MRNRNHHISVWLNEKELAHLRRQASITGLKVDPFIRSLIMGTDIRPRPPDEYGALLRELSAIGNNINQLARIANSTKGITPPEMARALELSRQAWQLLKERL
ncbi:MAG: MobC family plasmid mobilization relaxosome protein [Syntrophomonadaceae bacterium]|jgi:hypothetical protein